MKLIDMHTHSNYSDGSFPPSEVFSSAAEAGLSAFALTDHDTVDGLFPKRRQNIMPGFPRAGK